MKHTTTIEISIDVPEHITEPDFHGIDMDKTSIQVKFSKAYDDESTDVMNPTDDMAVTMVAVYFDHINEIVKKKRENEQD